VRGNRTSTFAQGYGATGRGKSGTTDTYGTRFSQIKIFHHDVREEDFPKGQVGRQPPADYRKIFRGRTRNVFLRSSPKDFSAAKTLPKI
jgi:hypothetical protein